MLLSFWRSFGVSWPSDFIRCSVCRILACSASSLPVSFGVRAPLETPWSIRCSWFCIRCWMPGIVGAVVRGLSLAIGHFRRHEKRQPCDECEFENRIHKCLLKKL